MLPFTQHIVNVGWTIGYDLEPKQAWRLARRLLYNVKYDPGIEQKNEWIYASYESDEYKKRFESWIREKGIQDDEVEY